MEVLASLTVGIGGGLPLGGDNISDEAAEELAAAAGAAASELAAVLATVQQLDTVAAQAVTSGLSSLFGLMAASDGSPSSASAGEQISAAVEQMARAATAAALASATVPSSGIAEPVVLSSANLNMTINVRSPSALAAQPISCDSGTGVAAAVAVPADLIGGIPGLDPSVPVAAVLHTSRVNLHGGLGDGGNATSSAGPTVSFKISQGGAELSVKDAPSPINISLAYQSPAAGAGQAPCVGVPDPFSAAARACGTTVQCKFWNETSRIWSTDGCATIMGADGSVGCSCTHLTEFIAIEFPTSAEELLALLLEAVAFNSLDMGDIECAFYRSWHTVRNVWYLIFLLVAMLIVLVGHAVRNDRRQMHDTLALLSGKKNEEKRKRQAKLNTSMEKRTLRRRQTAAPGTNVATTVPKATGLKSLRSMGALSSQMSASKVVPASASATASPPPSPPEHVAEEETVSSTTTTTTVVTTITKELRETTTSTTNTSRSGTVHAPQFVTSRMPRITELLTSSPAQSDGSTEIISLSDPVGVATPSNASASAMAALASAPTRAAGPVVVGAGAIGDPSPASAADPAAAPLAATASVLAAFGGDAKPTGLQRWKQAKHKTNATLLTKRWHKDVDRVWKRLFLACMYNHSLCAGITTRGVPGFTRAQTVMILVNGFAFELVMLLLLLPPPPPLPTDNVTGVPIEPEGPAVVINPIAMIFGAGVAASICIPMGLILTWLFDPIIIVNVSKNMAWFYLCWPYWLVWKRLEKCYRWLRVKCKRRSAKVAELDAEHSDEDPAATAATGASPPVSAKVKKTFARFDVNHNGYLEIQELRKALEHHGLNLSTAEAGRILSVYDDKPDGKLDLSEFAQSVRDLSAADEAPKVKQTFARFDANDSGYLEIQELRKALEHHGLNLSTAEAGRIMSSYDDKPNGKLDLSEFAQVIYDLSAADEAPAAPEPVMEKTKTHMRVGRHGVNVRKAAPKDEADKGEAAKAEVKAEAPRLAANSAARSFSYESLNDGLLKASLSYTWKNKDWPGVRHILLGWGLSIGMFGIFLLMTLFFGCSLFEPQDPAKNPYLPPLEEGEVSTHVPGDTVELIRTWLFSCGLRFFLNEPMIILASKGLPMLFASAFCANLCGEVIVESLNLLVTIMIEVIKSIKS
ncbi:calmodulin-like 5 [Chrysochromulina tobinii]|uniref:Calmodulin-like 5 n=2 Tax=Chrysochromulina tobinii TaxID=1460289 RepID=A0A0M0JTU8_9EUKA|nr:calmodulin-like 5 [Chrysochromulina tobinii]|eukprot:KOO30116.1 calmodulin-like 5 [Chrysochromulina sp. CCMP291]